MPGARLVEMRLPPGAEDKPHDHPVHSMFFVHKAKLEITAFGADGKKAGDAIEPALSRSGLNKSEAS